MKAFRRAFVILSRTCMWHVSASMSAFLRCFSTTESSCVIAMGLTGRRERLRRVDCASAASKSLRRESTASMKAGLPEMRMPQAPNVEPLAPAAIGVKCGRMGWSPSSNCQWRSASFLFILSPFSFVEPFRRGTIPRKRLAAHLAIKTSGLLKHVSLVGHIASRLPPWCFNSVGVTSISAD